jgi:YD repeat-containing protein
VDAGTVTRGYDADDRLTSVEDWLDHETDFAYDVGDAMTSIQRRASPTEAPTCAPRD